MNGLVQCVLLMFGILAHRDSFMLFSTDEGCSHPLLHIMNIPQLIYAPYF